MKRKRRSKQVIGCDEDKGRFIKCWNCGFHNDLSKITTGRGSGIVHEDFSSEDENVQCSGDDKKIRITLDTLSMEGVILVTGADGEEVTDYYTPRKSVAYGGCAFCGCKNLP